MPKSDAERQRDHRAKVQAKVKPVRTLLARVKRLLLDHPEKAVRFEVVIANINRELREGRAMS
ncbi:MAG: hypothetical protein K0S58_586 [Nitrospira sp.]|jgi:hypothetical protein|nr:hypothetical protein [Nitrospira sp.]